MRLCRNCRYLANREAVFCPHCARSFGGRRCAKGHLSPPGAVCCQICGTAELSEATGSIPLGFLPALLAGFLTLGAGALLLHFGGAILSGVSTFGQSSVTVLLGKSPAHLWRTLAERVLQFVLVWTVLLFLLPGKFGQEIRRGVGRLLTSAGWLLSSILSGIHHCFTRSLNKK